MRLIKGFVAALFITMGLFYFMSILISGGTAVVDKGTDNIIEFLRVKPDDHLETRRRKLPKKPPEPQKPPETQKLKVAKMDSPKANMNMEMPKMDLPIAKGGPFLGGGGSGDSEVMPLVRIEPQYPRKAAMRGIEGWVQLKFDVTEAGTVANVHVTNASPPNIFESSARRALLKWKYKPKMVDGKPAFRRGLRVQLNFTLEKSSQ